MSKWEKVKLGDIGEFKSGGTPTRNKPEYFEGEIPWITTTSLGKTFIEGADATVFISQEAVLNSATKIISKNSIMIGTRVGVGKVSINTVPMCTSQDIISIENIDNGQFYKPYILHCIKSYSQYFDTQKRGATIQGINSGVLKSIDIPQPPLEIQKQIAKTLDTAAELLAIRKQQLAELDNLIKATFYDMFGDLTTNEKKWNSTSIVDVCTEIVDCVNKTAPIIDEISPYKMLRTTNIKKGYVDTRNVNYVDEQTFQKWTRRSVPKRGDVLLTREAPIGETGIIESDDFLFLGQRIVSYRANNSIIDSLFLMYHMQSEYFQDQIRRLARGSTVKHLSVPECNLFVVYVPPIELQTQFANIVTKIEEQKALVKKAIDETQYLFNSLMSEYFE
ncbi:restriction endonuclease subunit S [Paenibacillus jilunlii]|uniref:Type I restriction enzyme, S subunit n=1 Tax=Paenibacillus jilunlii TaxID=682956 RepID=A0A1G9X6X2_9BACL|nr:restriction endonuclease subunit S [Paenibacillus jilunlii]SDM92510.1 type I restriction enzyme, S subunit [Paenibacillus jilunlii]